MGDQARYRSPRPGLGLHCLVIALIVAGGPGMAEAASTAILSAVHGGRVYELRVSEMPITWQQARVEAQSLGAHLVTIGSAAENEVLATLLDDAAAAGVVCEGTRSLHWLGLTDEVVEDSWQWVNGDFFSFHNWNTGEPNDYGTGEDYVVMVCPVTPEQRGRWNDTRVDHPLALTFFCEYPPLPEHLDPLAWIRTGDVYAVALDPTDPDIAYVGADNGVHTTTDAAVTWTRTSTGIGSIAVTALAVDPLTPTTVYAGTTGSGLFASTDAGQSWSPANSGLTSTEIHEIDINPQTPSTLFLETAGGVFRSTNGGASWSLLGTTPCDHIGLDPQQGTVLYTGCSRRYYRSDDSGDTWVDQGGTVWSGWDREWTVDPGNSNGLLFAAITGDAWTTWDALFRRASDGTFSEEIIVLVEDIPDAPVIFSIDFGAPGLVYTGAIHNLWKSTDGGDTWSDPMTSADGFYTMGTVHKISAHLSRVYSGTAIGLMASHDQGQTWLWPKVDLPGSPSALHISTGPHGIPMLLKSSGAVFRSTDRGMSWEPLDAGHRAGDIVDLVIDPVDPNTAYAGTWSWLTDFPGSVTGGVLRTIDGGDTWESLPINSAMVKLVVDPSSTSTVYAAAVGTLAPYEFSSSLYKSSDSGASWTWLGYVPTANNGVWDDLVLDPTDSSTLLASVDGLFRSTDGGSTWAPIAEPLVDESYPAILIDPAEQQTIYVGGPDVTVFRSDDNAVTWISASDGLPSTGTIHAMAFDPTDSTSIFLATSVGVFHSADRGDSWFATQGLLNTNSISVTTLDSGIGVWAGTSQGPYLLSIGFFADSFESGNTAAWSFAAP